MTYITVVTRNDATGEERAETRSIEPSGVEAMKQSVVNGSARKVVYVTAIDSARAR